MKPGSTKASPLLTIEQILHARPQKPTLTTRGRGWTGVTVDLHQPYYGCAESYPGLDHHLICYCPSGSSRLVQKREGKVHAADISAGMSYLMPAGYASEWEGDSGWSARLRIPVGLIAMAAEQLGPYSVSQVEIRNVFETQDPAIERFTLALLAELESEPHPAQSLVVDAVSSAVAAHLLRSHNAFGFPERKTSSKLSARDLVKLTAYIEDNLEGTIRLVDLAGLVNVSRFHFTRLFKRTTGATAANYVEQARIRRAQALIAGTDLPLAHVALAVGFADQSHFTRRFRRQLGCTPAAFARQQGRRRPTRRVT